MTENQKGPLKVARPHHAVPRKFMEPILYLAERMSDTDPIEEPEGPRMVDQLAEAVDYSNVAKQKWFRALDDRKACAALDFETAKIAALVVMTLVLKVDTERGDQAKQYFRKIRELLEMDPISVPSDLDEHKKLALRFLRG